MNGLGESLARSLFGLEDYWFEKRHGLDVSGIMAKDDSIAPDHLSFAHAAAYHPVWCRSLRVLLAEACKAGHPFDTFVDIGSGKGKACFYAHFKGLFRRILGVELSASLVGVANQNKDRLAADAVAFLQADAADFELPGDADTLVFMFNPFDRSVLERFISNNLGHFERRQSLIAYANDVHGGCLTAFGFETIFRDQTRKLSLYRHPAAERARAYASGGA